MAIDGLKEIDIKALKVPDIRALAEVTRLDQHLEALPYDDEGTATFAVIGASFTGLEVATE